MRPLIKWVLSRAVSLELSPCLRGSHLSARLPEELQKAFKPLSFDVRGRETVRHLVKELSCI